MTAAEVDETIARFRAKYPDLTADEEQAIHDYYAGKSPVLFLRNTFSPTRVQELEAEIERLTAYQNETALAWTKLTESQEEEIAKLKGEVVKWQIEAGKFGAGCPACDDIGEENERLREIRSLAQDYCDHFMQDEADEPEVCVSDEQHRMARALRDALAEMRSHEQEMP